MLLVAPVTSASCRRVDFPWSVLSRAIGPAHGPCGPETVTDGLIGPIRRYARPCLDAKSLPRAPPRATGSSRRRQISCSPAASVAPASTTSAPGRRPARASSSTTFPAARASSSARSRRFRASGCSTPSARSWTQLDTWEAWDGWRDAVLAHYCSQPHWGCPIGSLVGELAGRDPVLAAQVAAHMDAVARLPRRGARADAGRRPAAPDSDPRALALSTFAALQGGLLLTQTMESCEPLRAALDGALAALRAQAA